MIEHNLLLGGRSAALDARTRFKGPRATHIPSAQRPLPAAEIQTALLANLARLSLATNGAWPCKQAQRQHKEHRKKVRCPQDVRNSPTCACGITASFPDAGKHGFHELIADEHACGNQFFNQRAGALDLSTILCAQDDSESSNDLHVVSRSAAACSTVVEHSPPWSIDAMCDHLRLARPEIPVLDAGRNCDIFNAVSACPFHRSCRRPVFVLAGTDLLNYGVRNQDGRSYVLDQIESVDAGEQNEW